MRQALSIIGRVFIVVFWVTAFVPSARCGTSLPMDMTSQCCGHQCHMTSFFSAKDSETVQISAKKFKPSSAYHVTTFPILHRERVQVLLTVSSLVDFSLSPPGFSAVLRI